MASPVSMGIGPLSLCHGLAHKRPQTPQPVVVTESEEHGASQNEQNVCGAGSAEDFRQPVPQRPREPIPYQKAANPLWRAPKMRRSDCREVHMFRDGERTRTAIADRP